MEGALKCDVDGFRTKLAGDLFRYTSAISCRKMMQWIANKCMSQLYIESLEKVTTIPIPSESDQNPGPTETVKNNELLLKFIELSETILTPKLQTSSP